MRESNQERSLQTHKTNMWHKVSGTSISRDRRASTTFRYLFILGLFVIAVVFLFFLKDRLPEPSRTTAETHQSVEERKISRIASTENVSDISEKISTKTIDRDSQTSEPTEAALTGKVVEQYSAKPVAGINLSLSRTNNLPAETKSDESGVFTFSDLPVGSYSLSLKAVGDRVSRYYIPHYLKSMRITLHGGKNDLGTIEIPSAIYIAGKVLTLDDNPVENALLTIIEYDPFEPPPTLTTQSGPEGEFVFTNLKPLNSYIIACEAKGYLSLNQRVVKTNLRSVDDVIIYLEEGEGATISGKIVDQNEKGVEAVVVSMSHEDSWASVSTDKSGTFIFKGIRPGRATIHPTFVDLQTEPRSMSLQVKPGEHIDTLKFVLQGELKPGYISGVLLDVNQKPVSGGKLNGISYKENTNRTGFVGSAIPDKNGRFKMINLEEGLSLSLDYNPPSRMETYIDTDAKDILVPADNLVVTCAGEVSTDESDHIILRGSVFDKATQKAVQQFEVTLESRWRKTLQNSVVFFNPEGTFEFPVSSSSIKQDTPFSYDLQTAELVVRADGYTESRTGVDFPDTSSIENIRVMLEPATFISGKVLDSDYTPVENAWVGVQHLYVTDVLTDEEGGFTLTNIMPDANYFLQVEHPDYAPYLSPAIRVTEGEPLLDYVIRLTKGGTIMGYVLDLDGAPAANVMVDIRNIESSEPGVHRGKFSFEPITDNEGFYTVQFVPPGRYGLRVETFGDEFAIANVRENEVVTVNFGMKGSTLQGTVYKDGAPLPFYKVAVGKLGPLSSRRGGDFSAETITDHNGDYCLRGIPAGQHTLLVGKSYDDQVLITMNLNIPEAQAVVRDINIVTGSIKGTVVNASDHSPLSDVRVCLYFNGLVPEIPGLGKIFESFSGLPKVRTDENGHFEFTDLGQGSYTIVCENNTNGMVSVPLNLNEGQHVDGLEIVMGETGSIRIRTIHAETGEELKLNAEGALIKDRSELIELNLSNTPGVVENVAPGLYSILLMLRADDSSRYCSILEDEFLVEKDKETPVTIRALPAVEGQIVVEDTEGNPINDFAVSFVTPRDERVATGICMGNTIVGSFPLGQNRLILIRHGKTIFDDIISIAPENPAQPFETRITVKIDE